MRYNHKSILKIKSGQTVWRCLIWPTRSGATVSIEQMRLAGKKTNSKVDNLLSPKMFVKSNSYHDGVDYFLADIAHAHSFSTYRQAKRFEKEVILGMHDDEVQRRRESLDLIANW